MRVEIDTEILATGIEEGLYRGHDSVFKRLRLRSPMPGLCGIASTATYLALDRAGIAADLKISKPQLSFDPQMEHVIVSVSDDQADPLVIDPTYGQFTTYVGFDIAYDYLTQQNTFPQERVIALRESALPKVAHNLAKAALRFRDIKQDIINQAGFEYGYDYLESAVSEEEIAECLAPIWDPVNFSPYSPGHATLEEGAAISRFIDPAFARTS